MQVSYTQYLDRADVVLVPLAQAQPGDLLFFDTRTGASWFNPVTHVAIVVDPAAVTMVRRQPLCWRGQQYKTGGCYRAHPPDSTSRSGRDGFGQNPSSHRALTGGRYRT
jgi:cell wall-associated NlpC family hydrolase